MLRTMKRLIALSFGTALPVDAQRTRFTWPRPFLLRPCERRFTVIVVSSVWLSGDESLLFVCGGPDDAILGPQLE